MSWDDSKDGSHEGDQSPLRRDLKEDRLGLLPLEISHWLAGWREGSEVSTHAIWPSSLMSVFRKQSFPVFGFIFGSGIDSLHTWI